MGGIVDQQGRIRCHTEGSILQLGGHVLRGVAKARQFRIMNGRRTVGSQVGDEPVGRQPLQHRCTTGLDDMAAEHDDDGFAQLFGFNNGPGHRLEVVGF